MLNTENLSGFFLTVSLFFSLALLGGISCGKRKPPQPPVEKISQRTEISGIQQGNVVTLTWKLPSQNTNNNNLLNINRADVYRLAETLDSPRSLSEEEFASRSTLISSVAILQQDFLRSQFIFNDTLEFAGQNIRLRYAVRFVNAAGQKGSFSNFLLIEPTAKVSKSPRLTDIIVSEKAVRLKWQAPIENIDGSKPANILGYNIYRIMDNNELPEIVNTNPVKQTFFEDSQFSFGKNYKYFLRSLSLGTSGEPVESLNSNIISVTPLDVFAPSAPGGITIAAAPNNLSLFFASNSENGIAGYQIYRTLDANQPLPNWTLLTKNLLTANTFQDTTVVSGKTYFYYLVAVDNAGNVSAPSAVVSETAP